MQVRDFDPRQGQAFQGDVAIIPIPKGIVVAATDEIKPVDGRLIIQEGEVTGHHHAIELPRQRHFRNEATIAGDANLVVRDTRLRKTFAGGAKVGTARLYRDPAAVEELRRRGVLSRTDLAVGCLVVKDGPVVVAHDEHDGIRLPIGNYYVGRQVESAGAEERVVLD